MNDLIKGVLAMVLACTIWGLSSIYYKLVAHVPPVDVLAHRTLWSLVFFGIVIVLTRRVGRVRQALSDPSFRWRSLICSILISINWFLFIFAVQNEQAMEASLGYYIFPFVAVALGVFVLRERLAMLQALAIGLAALAVIGLTLGLGVAPWIALGLALTFGLYGLIKKGLVQGAITTVTIEVLILGPLALLWLGIAGAGTFGTDTRDTLLLMLSGPLTGGPLILLSYAAQRLNYATLGLVQYLNPTLQFGVAVIVFGEVVTPWHAIAFPLIWVALALYTGHAVYQVRRARRISSA